MAELILLRGIFETASKSVLKAVRLKRILYFHFGYLLIDWLQFESNYFTSSLIGSSVDLVDLESFVVGVNDFAPNRYVGDSGVLD